MSDSTFELRDVKQNALRTMCAEIDEAMSKLPATHDDLRAQWKKFVEVLALEPAHVLRECPSCKTQNMAGATRCGHCWAELSVPASG